MASKQQLTGMRGVYLVAAELARRGFIASPTSRSAQGADILVSDPACQKAFSVQVKTNARTFSFWLVGKKAKDIVSNTHVYVLVNIRSRKSGESIEYYVVPSRVVSKKMYVEPGPKSKWYSFYREDALPYENRWELFGQGE